MKDGIRVRLYSAEELEELKNRKDEIDYHAEYEKAKIFFANHKPVKEIKIPEFLKAYIVGREGI